MSSADSSLDDAGNTQDVHLAADLEKSLGSTTLSKLSNVWQYIMLISLLVQLFDPFYSLCIYVPACSRHQAYGSPMSLYRTSEIFFHACSWATISPFAESLRLSYGPMSGDLCTDSVVPWTSVE